MIHEYAIEPTVLLGWASNVRDYEEFLREYGLGTPRVLSSFPKKTIPKLRSYLLSNSPADNQSIISLRYIAMVEKVVENLVIRNSSNHNTDDWNIAVDEENKLIPFDVIISNEVLQLPQSCTVENMYSENSPWRHSNQMNIQRTFDSFASASIDLLRLSTEHVVFIDPFGWSAEAISTISFLLNGFLLNRVNSKLPTVTLFYKRSYRDGEPSTPEADYVKARIMEGLVDQAKLLELSVKELDTSDDSDVFHNRCILTELAGVSTGHGISLTGKSQHTDEATLMSAEIYQKKWSQFVEDREFQEVSSS